MVTIFAFDIQAINATKILCEWN